MDYGATDHYIATIQRLEADRNFWQSAATADEKKIAQLEADLKKAREELAIMERYARFEEATIDGITLYCDADVEGNIDGIYVEPMQDITDLLPAREIDNIWSQIDDARAQVEQDDADDLRS